MAVRGSDLSEERNLSGNVRELSPKGNELDARRLDPRKLVEIDGFCSLKNGKYSAWGH